MPVFYFNVDGSALHWSDGVGTPCRDLSAARLEAKRIAAEIVATSILAGRVPADATIEVEDTERRPVLEMPLQHAAYGTILS